MSTKEPTKLVFGYWALRGKAHTIRLMMEHLDIPYEEVTYQTPQSWYEDPLAKSNKNLELPYVIDNGFMIDESIPVLSYILKKNGYQSYLGIGLEDQATVDMYLWSMQNVFRKLISLSLKKLDSVQDLTKLREEFWKRVFQPKLQSIQNSLTPGNWYLGYLTFIDFDLHQAVNYVRILYPKRISAFPKIENIEKRISELPAIRAFNNSERNRNLCFLPVQMCKKFKYQNNRPSA